MPREIRNSRKKSVKKKSSYESFLLNLIVFLLLIQTVFLFYKNRDFLLKTKNLKQDIALSSKIELFPSIDNSQNFENDESRGQETQQMQQEQIKSNDSKSEFDDVEIKKHQGVVKISILNGCRVSGIAGRWKYRLIKKKYDVRETGNADNRTANSLILSRIKDMTPAYKLASEMGIKKANVYQVGNDDLVDVDLTVIIGMDYKKLIID